MKTPLTLAETADLVGRSRHVELSFFARLGERAPRCDGAAAVVYLAGASRAHGFRAGLLEALLPVSDGLGPTAAATGPTGDGPGELLDLVVGPGKDAELLDALVGVVYPAMAAAYAEHLAAAGSPSDAWVRRTLRRVLADLEAVAAEGREFAPGNGSGARA
ncbi:MAG: hypothetical protein WB383_01885, partial [Acidimicrobiales bacterium]